MIRSQCSGRAPLWRKNPRIALGTIGARKYLSEMGGSLDKTVHLPEIAGDFPTGGHRNRYGAILYIEKEGFLPLLKQARFAERYGMAVMSSTVHGNCAAYVGRSVAL